jgi:intein/homing endonuclease
MTDNSFSLVNLYPKKVINSKGEKHPFDEKSIAKVLNKETGLDMSIAQKVAEDVIRKIIGLGIEEITTNYIRELVCVELTQRGMNKYRNLFARAINLENISFKLDESFISQYIGKQPDWGPLGYITYKRTYARIIENENRKEEFRETIRRVVEGCYSIQKEHCLKLSLPWDSSKAQISAQKMFEKIWNFRMSPPGRGLWMMGTEFIARHGSMALNNCGFASTDDINLKYSKAFEFVMDSLMLGVGVGFDTKGAGKIVIKEPQEGQFDFQLPDSREGWVDALRLILEAYFLGKQVPNYDFSLIRPAGEPIRGFGGIASGPAPLEAMLKDIHNILKPRVGQKITSVDILDIMNHIGKCVVAGNVRRCLSGDSRVFTSKGLIPIEHVKCNDLVLTSDGSYKKVINKFDQGIQDVIKIKTSQGELICTKNHKIAFYNGLKSYGWKKANELTRIDRLISIPNIKGLNSISKDYAWLVGFYIGDGNAYIRKDYGGEVTFTMTKERLNTTLGKKCLASLKSIGKNPKFYEQDNFGRIKVYGKEFALEMYQYKKPKCKQIIPEFIWNSNLQIKAAFLAGLADADGGTRNNILYSKYPEFLKKIQKILISIGIATTLHILPKRRIKGRNKIYEGSHSLHIRGIQSQLRAKELIESNAARWKVELRNSKKNGLSIPYQIIIDAKRKGEINFNITASGLIRPTKTDQIGQISTLTEHGKLIQKKVLKYRDANFDTLIEKNLVNPEWMPIEIIDIEPAGTAMTYDIEVEDNHDFLCEGFLVHNSAEIALGDPADEEFVTSKQDKDKLYSHRWASNNSVFAMKGLDYSFIADQIKINGEPGVFWLENARSYSRMGSKPDFKDKKAAGVNPCIIGDTLIAVADGRHAVSIKQLAEEDADIPVYCKDQNGNTQIRMMRNPRITGHNQEIYEVKLDDGSTVKCTGNHKFILKDMTRKEAKDLKPGDSLVIMPKWQTTWSEMMGEEKKKRSSYWMLNTGKRNIFEHTFTYEQLNNTEIPKGYVIHHKDRNGLNNSLKNLEKILKTLHDSLHDISGDNNPMRKWWSSASKEQKNSYREKMSKSTSGEKNGNYCGYSDKEIYEEMIKYIKTNNHPLTTNVWKRYSRIVAMPHTSPRWGKKQTPTHLIKKANECCGFKHFKNPAEMREYRRFIIRKKKTDLKLIFNKCTFVVKHCENCGKEFKVLWSKREQAYCSHKCSNKLAAKQAGIITKKLAKKRHESIKQKMIVLFEKYIDEYEEVPKKSEFIEILNENNINDLRTAGLPDSYQNFLNLISTRYNCERISSRMLKSENYNQEIALTLKEAGLCYNHKVASVRKIGKETVYNGTVDEFHNFGIIINDNRTKSGRPKLEMVFTANCGEQTLESFELCCLVETFPSRHESYEEFQETLKYAYLYSKSVTLVNTHWKETNAVMLKNRRMGISQTGIIEAFVKHGRRQILDWCDNGYKYLRELDEEYSDWLCVPKSIKITTVKPSGTVSLLPGVPPGIHYPHSEYYIRRIRISKNSDLIEPIRAAGYIIEDDSYSPNTIVVEFPVHEKYFNRSKNEVSIWEQAENAAAYQRYWSDNQVSITITFQQEEARDIKHVLEAYEDKLKSVSFLPIKEHGYKQAPYEEITKEKYEEMISTITPITTLDKTQDRALGEVFCDSDKCEVRFDL